MSEPRIFNDPLDWYLARNPQSSVEIAAKNVEAAYNDYYNFEDTHAIPLAA